MEIGSSTMASQLPSLSTLKAANQQPELAGELIGRTIEGLLAVQSVQTKPEPVTVLPPESVTTGNVINTVA